MEPKGITDKVKFRMLGNASKYYLNGKRTDIDYPSSYIGERTPSRFRWTKMEHVINIFEKAVSSSTDKIIVDGSGRELTAVEFMIEIGGTRMWNFDFPLTEE